MFDLRYHVASLVAVFVALIVGILVGVGLASSGVTKKADLRVAQRERDDARANAQRYKDQRDQQEKIAKAFGVAYPQVMNGLLAGKRVGVLYVGSVDSGVNQSIAEALQSAGADPAARVLSLSVPVDPETLDSTL